MKIKHRSVFILLDLTDGSKENDGKEVSDWFNTSRDLCGHHVTLCGQQRSSQETAQLHRNIQKLRYLEKKSTPTVPSEESNNNAALEKMCCNFYRDI